MIDLYTLVQWNGERYTKNEHNPLNTWGYVYDTEDYYDDDCDEYNVEEYYVKWSTGTHNSYDPETLIVNTKSWI